MLKKVKLAERKLKRFTKFRPQIRSRHDTHTPLRERLPLLDFKSVVRLGSSTEFVDTVAKGGERIECNSVEAVETSSDKFLMKQAFDKAGVSTAKWVPVTGSLTATVALEFPLIAKHRHGSRGTGVYYLADQRELTSFINTHSANFSDYIVEEYHNYVREYRLHITENGCFYTCRKMLKNDAAENTRFIRNDSNCVWFVEANEEFDKPVNWAQIVQESIKALKAVKLDIGAVDVRVQGAVNSSGKTRKEPKFFIVEINSAPSFGDGTLEKYLTEIPKVLQHKYHDNIA